MNQLEQILSQFQAFADYLQTIDTSELRKHYTRQELKEFLDKLYGIKMRSLAYEISKIIEEMKIEEYPELLGVHHFPELRNIDFLTEEQKKKLDEYLARYRKGNYVSLSGFRRITTDSHKVKQTENFLIEKGIVEERYFVLCPYCGEGHLSNELNKEEREQLELLLKNPDEEDRYEKLIQFLPYCCMECECEPDLDHISDLKYKTVFKMAKERDTSLDYV